MSNYDFKVRAALGLDSTSAVGKFGFNSAIAAALETVWTHGGLYAYPAAATSMSFASSSASDLYGTSGAQQIKVYGLDANWDEVTVTGNLNGQTAVPLSPDLIRVNRVQVLGNTDSVGDIYVGSGTFTLGVPANVYAKIDAVNENQTLQCVYSVPAKKRALLFSFTASSIKNEEITASLKAREFGGVFQTKDKIGIFQTAYTHYYDVPLVFEPKTDIEVRAIGTVTSASVSSKFNLVLVPA